MHKSGGALGYIRIGITVKKHPATTEGCGVLALNILYIILCSGNAKAGSVPEKGRKETRLCYLPDAIRRFAVCRWASGVNWIIVMIDEK